MSLKTYICIHYWKMISFQGWQLKFSTLSGSFKLKKCDLIVWALSSCQAALCLSLSLYYLPVVCINGENKIRAKVLLNQRALTFCLSCPAFIKQRHCHADYKLQILHAFTFIYFVDFAIVSMHKNIKIKSRIGFEVSRTTLFGRTTRGVTYSASGLRVVA